MAIDGDQTGPRQLRSALQAATNLPPTAKRPAQPHWKPRTAFKKSYQTCVCGHCGRDVQGPDGAGLSLPPPNSAERRQLLDRMNTVCDNDPKSRRYIGKLMASTTHKVHPAHFTPDQLTPVKRGRHSGTAMSLRRANAPAGPSKPIEMMQDDVLLAEIAQTMPTQDRPTRGTVRMLDEAFGSDASTTNSSAVRSAMRLVCCCIVDDVSNLLTLVS
eukprot:SAG31_NODE_1076_length_10037_cov_8.357818_14_plen_215_part_00